MNANLNKSVSVKSTNLLVSVLVFLMCVSISTDAIAGSVVTQLIRYVFAILCAIFSLLVYRHMSITAALLFLCAAISGMLNILFIGNSTYTHFLYALLSVFIALLLCSPRLYPQCLLYAMYLHAFMVACHWAQYGLYTDVYFRSSNNYVSCHLLPPVAVYYSLLECRGKHIPKFPTVLVFIISILAIGRGGVLSTGILLAGVLLHSMKNLRPIWRVLLSAWMVVSAVIVIRVSSSWEIGSRFVRDGMSDNGRFPIWTQYLDSVFTNKLYFWLGARFKELPVVVSHDYNLHNSFLNIHAFNGIIMVAFLLYLLLSTIFYAIRHKRFILLTCMVSLFFRGLTDRLLWGAGSWAAPFMLFFFMIPRLDSFQQTRRHRWQSEKITSRLFLKSYF